MRASRLDCLSACLGIVIALIATAASAQTETVISNLGAGSDPFAPLTLASRAGKLYGATYMGRTRYGTIFSLTEKRGVWTHRVIYAFGGGNDGANPVGGVIEDSAGVLHGTTASGGSSGNGTAFTLAFNGSSWVHTVLYSFGGGADGATPYGDLTLDPATGVIYGTTYNGGPQNCGTVFELPASGGESVVYAFEGNSDGCNPHIRVREDSEGNLYGVTEYGGTSGNGVAYKLTESQGTWSESLLHTFSGAGGDGAVPVDIDFDPTSGALFGTTWGGGSSGHGTVYELSHTNTGWQENVLYSFQGRPDGDRPLGLHLDHKTGALYGTTNVGGTKNSGTVFQLIKNGGSWVEANLHSFATYRGDGKYPSARPTEDLKTGYLYGTTVGNVHSGAKAYLIMP